MIEFASAFQQNFYLTEEYAEFCSRATGVALRNLPVGDVSVYLLKNKIVSISNYPETSCREFERRKLTYLRVRPEVNGQSGRPSLMEYSLFTKRPYEQAAEKYKISFRHGLREGKKYPHRVSLVRRPDAQTLDTIYRIYLSQMRRHNSYVLPRSFFREYLALPSALAFLIESENHVAAYFCCFQHGDNLYASVGGGDPRFFAHKCSNKLYDELIRYACRNGLNIHLGLGEHGSGYQKFKENAGLVGYKTERHPDDEWWLRLAIPFLKRRAVGLGLALISRVFPRFVTYQAMPFT